MGRRNPIVNEIVNGHANDIMGEFFISNKIVSL